MERGRGWTSPEGETICVVSIGRSRGLTLLQLLNGALPHVKEEHRRELLLPRRRQAHLAACRLKAACEEQCGVLMARMQSD